MATFKFFVEARSRVKFVAATPALGEVGRHPPRLVALAIRHGEPMEPVYGFDTREAAEADQG